MHGWLSILQVSTVMRSNPVHLASAPRWRPQTARRWGPRGGYFEVGGTARVQLARQVPAPVLANMLGISITNATAWAARAGGTWKTYAARRPRAP